MLTLRFLGMSAPIGHGTGAARRRCGGRPLYGAAYEISVRTEEAA
jgi:hypothetical protein